MSGCGQLWRRTLPRLEPPARAHTGTGGIGRDEKAGHCSLGRTRLSFQTPRQAHRPFQNGELQCRASHVEETDQRTRPTAFAIRAGRSQRTSLRTLWYYANLANRERFKADESAGEKGCALSASK